MPRGCVTVFSTCTDAKRDDEFNRWYSHTHLPDLLHVKDCAGARRFREMGDQGIKRYMALYELDTVDLCGARNEIIELAFQAFELGRHIDCIAGSPSSDYLVLWEEIESESYLPLKTVRYSNADEKISSAFAHMKNRE